MNLSWFQFVIIFSFSLEQWWFTEDIWRQLEERIQVICEWVPHCLDWRPIWPGWLGSLCQDDWRNWRASTDCRWWPSCHQPNCKYLVFALSWYGQPLILFGSLHLLTNPYVFRGLRRLSRRSHAMLFCLRCLLYPAFFCWICSVCSTHIWTVRYWVLTYSPFFQVNQIGSVTESIEAVKMSKHAGWGVMTSHRRYAYSWCVTVHVDLVWYLMLIFLFISGETEDTFIADLAVGLATVRLESGYI